MTGVTGVPGVPGPAGLDLDDDRTIDELCRRATNRAGDVRQIVGDEVRRVAPLLGPDEQRRLAARALARLNGLGELEVLLADRSIDEIMVNSECDIWIDRCGSLTRAGSLEHQRVEHLVERILAPIGRRVDRTSPIVDARLPDGSRVCAVLPPVAVRGTVLSIRRFSSEVRPLTDFVEGTGLDLCRRVVQSRCNIVVSGATSSGKTSLLAALVGEVPVDERLLVIEDTAELSVAPRNVVRLEARPALADGPPPVELADLVRAALRLRPDRIVVGEVRGDEVVALVQAMNTGHDGSISTCHSNGPLDTLLRLESLVLQAAPSWPLVAIRQQIQRSIDVVVHVVRRQSDGRRMISSIDEVRRPRVDDARATPELRSLAVTRGGQHLDVVGDLERDRIRA
jgi:pilus assembly protein CpaF